MSISSVGETNSYSQYLPALGAVAIGAVGTAAAIASAPVWVLPVAVGGALLLLSSCGDISDLPTTPEGNEDFSDAAEEGIPGTQPAVTQIEGDIPSTQIDPVVDEDGGTCVDSDGSGDCGDPEDNYVLPVDAEGNFILTPEAFFSNTGVEFVSGTPTVNLEWSFRGYNGDINWNNYQVTLSSNSTLLPGMPAGAAPLPGLIASNQATEEETTNGWACPDPGYETFLLCPQDPSNQLPVYVAGFTLTFFNEYDAEVGDEITVENIPTDEEGIDNFFANTEAFSSFQLPVIGDELQIGMIPEEAAESVANSRECRLTLRFLVDNRLANGYTSYQTILQPLVSEIPVEAPAE